MLSIMQKACIIVKGKLNFWRKLLSIIEAFYMDNYALAMIIGRVKAGGY